MSDFKAKTHQNGFQLGLRQSAPDPAGELTARPRAQTIVAGIKGTYFHGRVYQS